MPFFKKKTLPPLPYDPETQEPAVRRSICTGEMTVGFIDKATVPFLWIKNCMKIKKLIVWLATVASAAPLVPKLNV